MSSATRDYVKAGRVDDLESFLTILGMQHIKPDLVKHDVDNLDLLMVYVK